MGKSMFAVKGNICSERVRLGRDGRYDYFNYFQNREESKACL